MLRPSMKSIVSNFSLMEILIPKLHYIVLFVLNKPSIRLNSALRKPIFFCNRIGSPRSPA
ncbi:MAG: hypothetical protein ACI906_002843 [Candidatus Latescibacterota bacterium]|jgi:hypothetical protein